MPHFIFAFHGGNMPDSPEEGAKLMAKWTVWMDGLGNGLINPGAPVGKSSTISQSRDCDGWWCQPPVWLHHY